MPGSRRDLIRSHVSGSHSFRHIHEALFASKSIGEHVLRNFKDRRKFHRECSGILDQRLIRGHVAGFDSYRQCLAGSIQDAAAIGRDLQSPQPLTERGVRKSLASYRLEVHQTRCENRSNDGSCQDEGGAPAPSVPSTEITRCSVSSPGAHDLQTSLGVVVDSGSASLGSR